MSLFSFFREILWYLALFLVIIGFILYFFFGFDFEEIFLPLVIAIALVWLIFSFSEILFVPSLVSSVSSLDLFFFNLSISILISLAFFYFLKLSDWFIVVLNKVHEMGHHSIVFLVGVSQVLLLVTMVLFRFHVFLDLLAAIVWTPAFLFAFVFAEYIRGYIVRDNSNVGGFVKVVFALCVVTMVGYTLFVIFLFWGLPLPFRVSVDALNSILLIFSVLTIFGIVEK